MFTIPPIKIKNTASNAWETTNTIHPYYIREDKGYFFVIYSDFDQPNRRNMPKEFKEFSDAVEWISDIHYPAGLAKFLGSPSIKEIEELLGTKGIPGTKESRNVDHTELPNPSEFPDNILSDKTLDEYYKSPTFILLDPELDPENISWSYCPGNAMVVRKATDFHRVYSAMVQASQLPSVSIKSTDTVDWMIREIQKYRDRIPTSRLYEVDVIDHGFGPGNEIIHRWSKFINSF